MKPNLKQSFITSILVFSNLAAMHNISRYFPFIEHVERRDANNFSSLFISTFFTDSEGAFANGTRHIPELWGNYDLRAVIESASAKARVCRQNFTNPLEALRPDLVGKQLFYNMNGKIKSLGVAAQFELLLSENYLIGAWIPFYEVTSNISFSPNFDKSTELRSLTSAELEKLDAIRRDLQSQIGLQAPDWKNTGFGDLDLFVRYFNNWDHKLLMKNIYFQFQTGILIPTSPRIDPCNPASVPFMGNGHFGYYGDLLLDLEIKQDWNLGFIFALAGQTKHGSDSRIPVAGEPLPFSAFVGHLVRSPGPTLKFSTYFDLGNLMDGLHLQARYTLLKHFRDKVKDGRDYFEKQKVSSFLNFEEKLSQWHATYISLQVTYDSKEAMKEWPLDPVVYAVLDFPVDSFSGNRAAKTTQFTLGIEGRF